MNRIPFASLVALACGIVFVASAIGAEGAPAPSPAPSAGSVVWMPVQLGSLKKFVHRMDRTLSSSGTQLSSERLVGSREEQVLAAPPEFAKATAELRVITRTRGGELGDEVETQQLYVSPTGSAYQVHAAKIETNGMSYLIRYPRPAVALKENAKVGEKWHVSTEDVAGLKGETWGEVVGLQDAQTPAGLFEKCLVVRYTGTMSGTVQVPGAGEMQITSGKVVVTEWHAQGVGLVLSKEELSETLLASNGVELVAASQSQTTLESLGRSAPASPTP